MKVVIIGGGPAGMMSAIEACKKGNDVILLEKNNKLGKKLLITGKGRCNITSSLNIDDFIKNVPGNGKFLYSSFNAFTNKDIINFLEEEGLKVKEERGNRIFPVTDKSQDVLNCFEKKLKKLNVKIYYNLNVSEILVNEENIVEGVKIERKIKDELITSQKSKAKDQNEATKVVKETIKADKVILATGGKSYPLTGSNGDGYNLAKNLGHTITKIKPSLVPLETYEKDICKNLQGLSLKNVKIKIIDNLKNKEIYEDFGEMLFTHFGVSGPIVLSSSAHLVRYKNIEDLLKNENIKLKIDLKPALTEEQLDLRILRDFEEFKNKSFKNSLDKLLPQKLIPVVIKISKIDENIKVNSITKEQRQKLVKVLKGFELTIKDFRPIEEAIITSGGINLKEVHPKTMESKIVKNLYFAGEILDVDAYTGGFNLQIAYSTGYVAGQNT